MVYITFKDGVSIELHEDMSFDVIKGSDSDCNLNYHIIMSESNVDFIDNDAHSVIVFNKINNRLGGILTP